MTERRRSSVPARRTPAESASLQTTAKVKHLSRTTGAWAFAAGNIVADRYELTVQLAKGGMSLLWAALDRHLGREVVVKFLRTESGKDLRARFEAEARVSASLRSRHIVEVYDVGVAGEVPFMVLERLLGEDLEVRLARQQRLALRDIAWVARQTASGLQVAHRAGVVHRDIKPSNLFLAMGLEPGDELLKILDFGVAKAVKATGGVLTRPGVVVGSPLSMSPEQVNGRGVDHRADLFALGTVLYRCAVGHPPFRGATFAAILAAVVRGEFDLPSHLDPSLPSQIDVFFTRALAVNPDDRFKSGLELASAFEGLVASTGPM